MLTKLNTQKQANIFNYKLLLVTTLPFTVQTVFISCCACLSAIQIYNWGGNTNGKRHKESHTHRQADKQIPFMIMRHQIHYKPFPRLHLKSLQPAMRHMSCYSCFPFWPKFLGCPFGSTHFYESKQRVTTPSNTKTRLCCRKRLSKLFQFVAENIHLIQTQFKIISPK